MIIHDFQQGTDEWRETRIGKFTSSTFGKLFMSPSTKGYNDLINQIVYERITGESPESFSNQWMERGTELEPEARQAYELQTFNKVHQVGFVELNEWVGGSPDGLIDEDGMIEIKCPKSSTLIDYALSDKVPKDYEWQMQGNLYVTGRAWCDFWVYHPKLNPLFIKVERDEKKIKELEAQLEIAIEKAKERIQIISKVA